MTEREAKTLLKLLDKFRNAPKAEIGDREAQILDIVRRWVKWYGNDEMDYDLK